MAKVAKRGPPQFCQKTVRWALALKIKFSLGLLFEYRYDLSYTRETFRLRTGVLWQNQIK